MTDTGWLVVTVLAWLLAAPFLFLPMRSTPPAPRHARRPAAHSRAEAISEIIRNPRSPS